MGRHRGRNNAVSGGLLLFIFVIGIPLYLLGQLFSGDENANSSEPEQEVFESSNDESVLVEIEIKKDPIQERASAPEMEIKNLRPSIETDLEPGERAHCPIVLTADELLDEVETDIDRAEELYKYKWIQLTGKVVSVTHNEINHYRRTDYGKTTNYTTGEVQYNIDGVTIKSALIYWLAVNKRFERADIAVEMDTSLCIDPEKGAYIYYPQHSTVTVVAYCAGIGAENIVFTDGRYPLE